MYDISQFSVCGHGIQGIGVPADIRPREYERDVMQQAMSTQETSHSGYFVNIVDVLQKLAELCGDRQRSASLKARWRNKGNMKGLGSKSQYHIP